MDCKVCIEKQKEIVRILTAYKKDKKFYRKVVLSLIIALIITAFLGSEGIYLITDIVKGFIK